VIDRLRRVGQQLGLVRTKAAVSPLGLEEWNRVTDTAGWFPVVRESFAGAFQRGMTTRVDTALSHSTVWSCMTLIANDLAKMGIKLVAEDSHGICVPADVPAYSPVLRKPNHYQNRIQFIKNWAASKLGHGATYVLKARDNRNVVRAMYILDPQRVRPLVSSGGEVFYQLNGDDLAAIGSITVPARDIIHDIYFAPFHPLCGVGPITASALATGQGLRILNNTSRLFENGSQPGGVLTAPGTISTESAKRIQDHWDSNFKGEANFGKVAVLGDGLKFEQMSMSAVDAQLIDQLKWGDEKICSAFHVPPYMVGVGAMPTYNNIEALNQQYYAQCLQILVEELELCLEEGLAVAPYEIEFDTDDLLRMDSATQMKFVTDGVKGGVFTPNEGRQKFNRPPIQGGDTVYLQDQDHSLQWLSRRDAMPIDPKLAPAPPTSASAPPKAVEPDQTDDALVGLRKELGLVA
jgi:HK97 family phage portal protein